MTGIDKYEIISFYLIFISMRKNDILKHFFYSCYFVKPFRIQNKHVYLFLN